MNDVSLVWGIDFGIRNGGIASLMLINGVPTQIHYVHSWSSRTTPSTKAPLPRIVKFLDKEVIQPLQHNVRPGMVVAIDWDPHDIFFGRSGSNRKYAQIKAFLAGVLYKAIIGLGAAPVFVSPRVVRKVFRLKSQAHKLMVHRAFTVLPTVYLPGKQNVILEFNSYNEHVKDSVILAYVTEYISRQGGHRL